MAMGDEDRFFGKYMGAVRDANDPDSRGRLRLYVPEVMGDLDDSDHWTDWALPCFPWFAHNGIGLALVPKNDSSWRVWVEFRQGDSKFPIWVGVFPVAALKPDTTQMELDTQTLQLGGICNQPPGATNEGVVLGSGIDSFTGSPYSLLGSASTRVFAKKT